MWGLLKKNGGECSRFLASIEGSGGVSALTHGLAEHPASCKDCRAAVQELLESRALLEVLPRQEEVARPWFAPRVMAAIAAREFELRPSLEAWTAVPNLAAKLTWVSALALLLTSTWLIGWPMSAPTRPVVTDLTGEPVVENTPAPATNDDVLGSLTERAR
jgi:hypothetical protein